MVAAVPSPALLFDEEELQQYILLYLGAPQVKVELVPEDLQEAINQAKRWFSSKKGLIAERPLTITAGVSEYQLPTDVDTVVDVYFMGRQYDFSRVIDPLGLIDGAIPYNLFPHPQAAGLISTYVQSLQYLKTARRIVGGEPEWAQSGRTLQILPIPRESGTIMVRGKLNNFTLDQLPERDHDYIKQYAVAWAMMKLARVYIKYAQYPGAQGAVNLPGASMMAEATAKMAELSDALEQSGYPMGILTG